MLLRMHADVVDLAGAVRRRSEEQDDASHRLRHEQLRSEAGQQLLRRRHELYNHRSNCLSPSQGSDRVPGCLSTAACLEQAPSPSRRSLPALCRVCRILLDAARLHLHPACYDVHVLELASVLACKGVRIRTAVFTRSAQTCSIWWRMKSSCLLRADGT